MPMSLNPLRMTGPSPKEDYQVDACMVVNTEARFSEFPDCEATQTVPLDAFSGASLVADLQGNHLGGTALRLRVDAIQRDMYVECKQDLYKDGALVIKKGCRGAVVKPVYKDVAGEERIDVDFSFHRWNGERVQAGILTVSPRQVINPTALPSTGERPILHGTYRLKSGVITFKPVGRHAQEIMYLLGSSDALQAEPQSMCDWTTPFNMGGHDHKLKPGVPYTVEAKLRLTFFDKVSEFQGPEGLVYHVSRSATPMRKRQRV
eukprot:TRINITY_DN81100_c0_g1_i1.p1 TRINITY_DN81100_c0_g1~~TRINITY_DN81100_c0_g1_i1.p1  ORF type:complete len:262 (-),score=44.12 TRINITY_DN81100_c0_g1_i1:201-986(-)